MVKRKKTKNVLTKITFIENLMDGLGETYDGGKRMAKKHGATSIIVVIISLAVPLLEEYFSDKYKQTETSQMEDVFQKELDNYQKQQDIKNAAMWKAIGQKKNK